MITESLPVALTNKIILDGHKLDWHKDRVEAWLRGERIAPITIDMALTRACSYNCYFCYATLQDNDGEKMTKDVIFRFLDDAADIGVKAISFVSDGESTVSPYLNDAIIYGKKNGLDIALGTNGYLLKDEKLPNILPCLTYLRFNFSAGESKRYSEIMGTKEENYYKVVNTVKEAVRIKKENSLDVTIGLQMVLQPQDVDQIIPLVKLGKDIGVDYTVIKHCSDDEDGSLGVDYDAYHEEAVINRLKEAESYSEEDYLVKAKWSKILSGGVRKYSKCYGTPFIFQLSGSGLVAPCGKLFNEKYKKHHIGNIADTSFKKLWQSDEYWEKHNYLHSPDFDPRTMCGNLCLQHKVNERLYYIKENNVELTNPVDSPPMHVNFI